MKFKADEIASVILKEIEDFRGQVQTAEVGRVIEVGDGIARCTGLSTSMSGEMSSFPMALAGSSSILKRTASGGDSGDYLKIIEGDEVKSTGQLLSVPVGAAMLVELLTRSVTHWTARDQC